MRLIFAATMVALIIPMVLIALIAEMTWKRLIVLAAMIVSGVALSLLLGARRIESLLGWVGSPSHLFVVGAATLVIVLLLRWGVYWRFMRRSRSLVWENGLSQREFERRCVAFMRQSGWKIAVRENIGSLILGRFDRGGSRVVLMFVGLDVRFQDIVLASARRRLNRFGELTLVFYQDPDDRLVRSASEQGWLVMHYTGLHQYGTIAANLRSAKAENSLAHHVR